MADVVFNDVDKIYDNGFHAVQDLSLDIKDGEFLVLVGPSGCGKTTALRMVAGLEEISGGEISIGGRVVNQLTPKERDIAMVFQNYALYPHLSVYENIAFGLRLRKEPKDEMHRRVGWAAKMLDLTPYLDRKPKELSGGQRQRVAMGRAIVRQPQVFLMDEPLSNLDAKLRVQMRADIAQLQHELETTTIYVTHDQVEAMTMGDRVAVMSNGVLQQVDDRRRLYDAPGEPVRRRLHRHAADEPARGACVGERRGDHLVCGFDLRSRTRARCVPAASRSEREDGGRGHPQPVPSSRRRAVGPADDRGRASTSSRPSAASRSSTSTSTRSPSAKASTTTRKRSSRRAPRVSSPRVRTCCTVPGASPVAAEDGDPDRDRRRPHAFLRC